jgi:hypothetical protein
MKLKKFSSSCGLKRESYINAKIMQHIIKKQIINLSIDKKIDAFHLQQRISVEFWSKIVPLLEKIFDAVSLENETISLDKLEIDVGMINVKQIEKGNFEEVVFKKINEQLTSLKYGSASKIKAVKEPTQLSISGQWIFYMRHGYLPWNTLKINAEWYKNILESFASDSIAINNLRNLINNDPNALERIVLQNREAFLKSLIETLTAENQKVLPGKINEIAGLIYEKNQFKRTEKKELKQKLWRHVLKYAASSATHLKSSKIVGLLLINNFPMEDMGINKMTDFLLKNKIDPALLKNGLNEKDIDTPSEIEQINEEGIFVTNAGIILLHPFLNLFFSNLHLVYEGSFVNKTTHQKALCLLHYLATGNSEPEEHELAIPKVLCAYPLEIPVSKLVKLTSNELNEGESVMESAIGQWEILKSTSPDGLREGFLKRNGKLFTKNGSMHLQMEASSIDMLLDYLPWNLSVIKLPWMKEVLNVTWR